MTQQDKDILLEKMLDPGAVLTESEIAVIIADEELREIFEVSSAVKGACVQPSAVDVEKEWRLFRHKILPKPSRWRWAMRVAAIFLGVMFMSAIIKVGIDRIMKDDIGQAVAESKPAAPPPPVEILSASEPLQMVQTETVAISEKASAPISKTVKRSIPSLTAEEETEVDEYLRLQQARIDNDLAMMEAELYVDQLQAISFTETVFSSVSPVPLDDSEIRSVIMP